MSGCYTNIYWILLLQCLITFFKYSHIVFLKETMGTPVHELEEVLSRSSVGNFWLKIQCLDFLVFLLTLGGPVRLLSSTVRTVNSQDSRSTEMLLRRAEVWRTAVRNPVGKVNPDIQNTMGGWADDAHFSNWSTRAIRSRVQDARGFIDGYAWKEINYFCNCKI